MPCGCSADYCTNSHAKRFQICRFPKDPERKKIWIQNMNQTDLTLGLNARLCSVHFTANMWIQRNNGTRILKSDAVPTILGEHLETTVRGTTVPDAIESDTIDEPHAIELDMINELDTINEPHTINEPDAIEPDANSNENQREQITSEEDITEEEKNTVINIPVPRNNAVDASILQRLERMEKLWEKSERLRLQMKKKLQQARRNIKRLQMEVRRRKIHPNMNNIFNEDEFINVL